MEVKNDQSDAEAIAEDEKMTNGTLYQISCKKAVNGENFARGNQEYSWNVGAGQGWVPNKSYFRIKCSLTANGRAVELKDGLALADNVCGNMWNNISFRMGGQEVSSQKTYCAQADILRKRLTNSNSYLKSIGRDTALLEPDFGIRQQITAANGTSPSSKAASISSGATEAKVAIIANTGVVTGTGNTLFNTVGPNQVFVGDILVVGGVEYTVVVVTNNTTLTVLPKPAADVAATSDAYVKTFKPTAQKNSLWLEYTPSIGIFGHESPLLAGEYSLWMNPNADYKKSCVEAARDLVVGLGVNQYEFTIDDIQFFAAIYDVPNPMPSDTTILHLTEIEIVSKQYSGSSVLDFVVPTSSRGFAVFVQGLTAGSSNTLPPSRFVTVDGAEENLKSIQLTYSNRSKPSTDYDSSQTATENGLLQRYYDTYLNSDKLFDTGGVESFKDWQERGQYYYFDWAKVKGDRSTNLQLRLNIDGLGNGAANVMVAAFYTKATEIESSKGYILSVSSWVT